MVASILSVAVLARYRYTVHAVCNGTNHIGISAVMAISTSHLTVFHMLGKHVGHMARSATLIGQYGHVMGSDMVPTAMTVKAVYSVACKAKADNVLHCLILAEMATLAVITMGVADNGSYRMALAAVAHRIDSIMRIGWKITCRT